EIHHCWPILQRQIEIIQPKCLLLLGRTAAGAVLDRHEALGKLRREEHVYRGIPAFVTYHPAALLRNAEYKRPAWEDLKRLKAKLEELGYDGSAAAS
ncbi:MAG: uracil-DNA glycosylase, partial [Chitinivibrionales bacterium]|nr:uracil-DNA glycosylase [Chitinivibrionales bacterium]